MEIIGGDSPELQLNFDIEQLHAYIDEGIGQRYAVLENPLASIDKAGQGPLWPGAARTVGPSGGDRPRGIEGAGGGGHGMENEFLICV